MKIKNRNLIIIVVCGLCIISYSVFNFVSWKRFLTSVEKLRAEIQNPDHVAAGDNFTCASHSDGQVLCWIANRKIFEIEKHNSSNPIVEIKASHGVCLKFLNQEVICYSNFDNYRNKNSQNSVSEYRISEVISFDTGQMGECFVFTMGRFKCRNKIGEIFFEYQTNDKVEISQIALASDKVCILLQNGVIECFFVTMSALAEKETLHKADKNSFNDRLLNADLYREIFVKGGILCGTSKLGQNRCFLNEFSHVEKDVSEYYKSGFRKIQLPENLQEGKLVLSSNRICVIKNDETAINCSDYRDGFRSVDVQNFGASVLKHSSGNRHGCALLSTNRIKCWGFVMPGGSDVDLFPAP